MQHRCIKRRLLRSASPSHHHAVKQGLPLIEYSTSLLPNIKVRVIYNTVFCVKVGKCKILFKTVKCFQRTN
jgi:hypothetical protein